MSTVQTSFERFEFKYWMSHAQMQQFLSGSAAFLKRDDHAEGGQHNTSLYLDSPRLDFARLHMEKAPDRLKLRIRVYGRPPNEPAFVEIKRKAKAVTLKQRAVVPLATLPSLLRGEIPSTLKLTNAEQQNTLSQFLYLMQVYRAEPQLLITARRQAFASIDPSEGLRLTLDHDICYQPARGPSLFGSERAWINLCGVSTYVAPATTLMEVKFRYRAPVWLGDLIQSCDLRRSRFSKYIAAVQHEAFGREGVASLARTPSSRWFKDLGSLRGGR
ncbi:MAG: polyphosphate polymerase domain-containing protein [Myxococcales bacterium]|nr:polyphosphate polymerase domain-containing protein [Myxococcales bacterium]